MSDMLISTYSHFGASTHATNNRITSTPTWARHRVALYAATTGDDPITSTSLPVVAEAESFPDPTAVELASRHLTREIELAEAELLELEETVRAEENKPSVRMWLLPLMAIGLALSFYGSFTSTNSAELGATGLMLLWSLSAFWFIYTREKQQKKTREANRAEIEIWSNRIEELQQAIEQNQRMAASIYEGEARNS